MEDGDGESQLCFINIDFREASAAFVDDVAKSSIEAPRAISIIEQWANTSSATASQVQLLDALSHIILNPFYTEKVAIHFSPLLIAILDRSLQRTERFEEDQDDSETIALYHCIARLVHPFPTLLPLARFFLKLHSRLFSTSRADDEHLGQYLLSTYRLVNTSADLLPPQPDPCSYLKSLLSIVKATKDYSIPIRLLALRLYASLEDTSDSVLQQLQDKFIGNLALAPVVIGSQAEDAQLTIQYRGAFVERLNAYIYPLEEHKRVQELRTGALLQCSNQEGTAIESSVFGERVTCLGRSLFFRAASTSMHSTTSYRVTRSIQASLSSLSEKLSNRLPILISGPEACGKSSIIKHACCVLHPFSTSHIITFQLGDQSGVDAKSLLGTYISSTKNPGTFEWAEGALTRAVRLGKWIVLEDIDKASDEVLSTIKPLVEDMGKNKAIGFNPSLDLGSRGRVFAAETFALFATRTTPMQQRASRVSNATFYGNEHWDEVQMKPLSNDDIFEIIKSKNPLLSTAEDGTLEMLADTWSKMSGITAGRNGSGASSHKTSNGGSLRFPSLHDLLKWCQRIEISLYRTGSSAPLLAQSPLSNQALHEEIFLEACDIFLGANYTLNISSTSQAISLFHHLAECLRVDANEAWHNYVERRPECKVEFSEETGGKIIRIGRTLLQRSSDLSSIIQPPSRNFALTGPAARLMERIAVCVSSNEPTLLVGETGTGKTTVVQYLASLARKPLIALNLSQQTEASDLVGGFKPLDAKLPAMELHNEWVDLFQSTFSSRRNARYMQAERKAMLASKWARLCETWKDSIKLATDKLGKDAMESGEIDGDVDGPRSAKARRITQNGDRQDQVLISQASESLLERWNTFRDRVESFAVQFTSKKRNMVFSFVEGPLIKAIQSGSWVLLDEINLATAETLDCLTALLQSSESSIVLTEKGDLEPVPRHADFRLFACMNPATDIGKKDLPNSLRSRFTELYAPSPDSDEEALIAIVDKYIGEEAVGDRGLIMDIAQCYRQIRQLSQLHQLADGANQRPHYSIRTLSRALIFAKDICAIYGLRRAVWEGFLMTFTMLLDESSATTVRSLLDSMIMSKGRNARSAAVFVPSCPTSSTSTFVQLGPFWLEAGAYPLDSAQDYILTPSVQEKLIGLARAILTRRSPVLIQGPTSAGKTSAIEYLARRTGHKFVRINNHEHTDIQEYVGSYSSDPDSGQLVFQEGLLVTALRQGHWIVLDELNLAPSDVLEALNRLLDDNRELFVSETGETIKPHSHFMLFATQNPPGQYAGRKELSRAFRNRFLEIHFADVPQAELETILTNRCRIAPSYAEKIVKVFRELQRRRQTGRVFDTKQAFVTLRDLFRWGNREAMDYQQLAENGYMLIAERARRTEDALVVKEVIEEVVNVKIDTDRLYDIFDDSILSQRVGSDIAASFKGAIEGTSIVWTSSMQRLVCLIASSLRNNEPVLLVGETGSGKTSVCEVLSNTFKRRLMTVNCHQNTDTSDLLGGQRPLRNRAALKEAARCRALDVLRDIGVDIDPHSNLSSVAAALASMRPSNADEREKVRSASQQIIQSQSLFQWHDGPLVEAMKQGQHMLLDEISLADDSVLERLNSVLEPDRTLVLAERSSANALQALEIKADPFFQIVATMNPGGDYGKKELSPALRNRFTEIWVPSVQAREDLELIIDSTWKIPVESRHGWAARMVEFLYFFIEVVGGKEQISVGLRDLIAWAQFINATVKSTEMSVNEAFAHGAFMTFIDGVPLHSAIATRSRQHIKGIVDVLRNKVYSLADINASSRIDFNSIQVAKTSTHFSIGRFGISIGKEPTSSSHFSLVAPTPANNALRVLRAMQIQKRAIMLEGSPGAGKTSLIVALARESNHKLTRINLSDQTDLSDLFGADLPVEGGKVGEFDWKDAAFLQAMQEGSWVLLDEMNLASQTVLEGLNSCLDHRGSVFVPELGRSFDKHANFRIFAAQNPQCQGGGRKGLPRSFLNRFTKVYIEELHEEDFCQITSSIYAHIEGDDAKKMIKFNSRLQALLSETSLFSKAGQPWEFNLRDLLRWFDMIHARLGLNLKERNPLEYLGSLYLLRFRSRSDRVKVARLYHSIFGVEPQVDVKPWFMMITGFVQLGHVLIPRRPIRPLQRRKVIVQPSQNHYNALQALGECVKLAWPAILVGESASGKTTLIRQLAEMTNGELEEVRLSSGTDAVDVIGGFQQEDSQVEVAEHIYNLRQIVSKIQAEVNLTDKEELNDLVWRARSLFEEQKEILSSAGKDSTLLFETSNISDIVEAAQKLLQSSKLSLEETEICTSAVARLSDLSQQHSSQHGGKFAWIDGPVLRAMRKGYWLLLDDANLCSSSVLDRLNSLLEPNGNLVLSERGVMPNGQIEVAKPHHDFRIFFAINPRYGELSRAMRNRGLEIYLDPLEKRPNTFQNDAVLGNLARWTQLVEDEEEVARHKQAMRIALLGQGMPYESLLIASRVMKEKDWQLLQDVLNEGILADAGQLKMLLQESSGVDLTFLKQISLDLQLNPVTRDCQPAQIALYDRIQLLVKCRAHQTHLQNCVTSASTEVLSILQRSALYHQGHEMEDLIRQDRDLYPFINTVIRGIRSLLTTSDALDMKNTRRYLYVLFDCCGYLTDKWSKSVLNDYSSSSVILSKAFAAARQLARNSILSAKIILDSVEAMMEEVRLDTGLAMRAIWKAFLPRDIDAKAIIGAVSLSQQLDSIKNRRDDEMQQLVSTSIDVAAALWTVGEEEDVDVHRDGLLDVARRARDAVSLHQGDEKDLQKAADQSDNLLLSILFLTSQHPRQSGAQLYKTRKLINLIKSARYFPTDTAIFLQRQNGHAVSTTRPYHLDLNWVKQIFRSSLPFKSSTSSTEDLFHPILFTSVLACCSTDRSVPLEKLLAVESETQRMAQIISCINPAQEISRARSICNMLVDDLEALSDILLDTIKERMNEVNDQTLLNAIFSVGSSGEFEAALQDVVNSNSLPSAIQMLATNFLHCASMRTSLQAHEVDEGDDLERLGSAVMQYGVTVINSFLPNVAIDPLVTLGADDDFRRYQIHRLEQEREAILEMEAIITGNEQSSLTEDIDIELEQLRQARGTQQEVGIRGSNTTLLHKLISEMNAFVQQIVSREKMNELLQAAGHGSSRGRLVNLQMTISAQLDRLSLIYASLWDLVQPLKHALSMMLLGIGLLLHASSLQDRTAFSRRTESILHGIAAFPTSLAVYRFSEEEIPIQIKADSDAGAMMVPLLLLKVKAILVDVNTSGKTPGLMIKLRSVYDQLWHLWTLDEEHQRKKLEEETSLYKMNNLDMSVEEEAKREEEDFLALFPQYVDVMEDQDVSPEHAIRKRHKTSKGTFYQPGDLLQLFHLHFSIFKGSSQNTSDTFEIARINLCRSIIEANYGDLSEVFDRQSASLQFTILHETLYRKEKHGDFYTGANTFEAMKLISLLGKMIDKVDRLIKDWPDQEVLHHIRQRCERILRLDSMTSIHQMLAALEGLLQHTEDWEIFASSKNTLQAERNDMTELIIEWRSLELTSWKALLSKETLKSRDSVNKMWFTLFQVTTKTDLEEGGKLEELVSLLDQYMRGSTLGQFNTRLDMIESFASYLGCMRDPFEQSTRIESTLINIHRFFSLFSASVQSKLDSKRSVIEREISDFVKLASWKDTNVHALKVSAAKTHRKLHRCLRKYRAVLNEAVDPILASLLESSKVEKAVAMVNGHQVYSADLANTSVSISGDFGAAQVWHAANAATPMHLVRLSTTLQSLQHFSAENIKSLLQDESASLSLIDLQTTIVSRAESLAKQTPSFWKQDNEKLIKHLETRKRKAWSDLLKELRRIGLTISTVDGVSASELHKGSIVFGISPLQSSGPLVDDGTAKMQESDRMHYQLLSLLPVLRASINGTSRSEDIQISQLQRGLSFVENCFLASIVERQKLCKSQAGLFWLRKVCDRMCHLADNQAQCLPSKIIDRLPSVLDSWTRLSSALHEIGEKADSHLSLFSKDQLSNDSVSVLTQLAASRERVDEHVSTLRDLVTSVEETACMVATESELTTIGKGESTLSAALETLQHVIDLTPALCSMCIPTRDWLRESISKSVIKTADVELNSTAGNDQGFELGKQSDRIISSILLIAQSLRGFAQTDSVIGDKDGNLADRGVVYQRQRLAKIHMLLRFDEINHEITRYLTILKECSTKSIVQTSLARLVPFLQVYDHFKKEYIISCSKWYHSLLKLDLTLCKLIISLTTRGFCRPRQEEEQGGEAGTENDEQIEGGMGLGEGGGAQDVTDTLQDDEMMEELEKGENEQSGQDDGEGETKGEKNAREMDEDFDGELGDVEKEEDDEGGDKGEEDDAQQEEEAEIDEAVGKVDPLDLDAVDEKTWGGEEKSKEEGGKDKSEKEQQGRESEKESSKEGKEASKGSEEDQEGAESAGQRGQEEERSVKKEAEKEEAVEKSDEMERGEEGEANKERHDESEMEEQTGEEENIADEEEGLGRAIDAEARQTDNLDFDLDEDLQMDDVKSNADSDGDMDALSDVVSEAASADEEDANDMPTDDISEQGQKAEENKTAAEEEDESRKEEEEKEIDVPHEVGEAARDEQEDDAKSGEDVLEQQNMTADSGLIDDMPIDDANMGGDVSQNHPADQMQSTRSRAGRQANAPNDANATSMQGEEHETFDESQSVERPIAEEAQGPSNGEQKEQGEGEMQAKEDKAEDSENAAGRNLGDALRDFERNMDSIEERLGKEANQEGQGMPKEPEAGAVEHILEDEDAEMQALGAAQEDEMLNGMQDVDLGVEDESQEDDRVRVDEEIQQIEARKQLQPDQAFDLMEEQQQRQNTDGQGGLMMNEVRAEMHLDDDAAMDQDHNFRPDMDKSDNETIEESEETPLDRSIELQMNALLATTDVDSRHQLAQDLWKSYLVATNEYAFTLSEQLRLILTPTKATKLTGDFKTGKRLNMRKIIPFIASDYVKDKIWLRRNLPQKREYQILLCIDDSKSMLESKNMLLAYKSLALVCSAFDKLKVGQLGVMKFGKEAELLKDFDGDLLREYQGGNVLEKLQFQQRGTDVSAMLQSSYKVLCEAKEKQSATSSQLWQLQIIISDGVCQDHAKLSALLRRASEEQILVVFVILDSLQQNSSILTMNSVQYITGANGRSHIQMTRYLDTFPFEYFVVVRDVGDLPEVLSTTLRQWAQKIAES